MGWCHFEASGALSLALQEYHIAPLNITRDEYRKSRWSACGICVDASPPSGAASKWRSPAALACKTSRLRRTSSFTPRAGRRWAVHVLAPTERFTLSLRLSCLGKRLRYTGSMLTSASRSDARSVRPVSRLRYPHLSIDPTAEHILSSLLCCTWGDEGTSALFLPSFVYMHSPAYVDEELPVIEYVRPRHQ